MEGCTGSSTIRTNLQLHYMHRHMEDIVVVINEGTVTHSRYEQCDMFIPQGKMEGGHLGPKICKIGDEIIVTV